LQTKGTHKESFSPADGTELAVIKNAGQEDCETIIRTAKDAFLKWRLLPAPARGEIVRQIGIELRKKKDVLGVLVSLEMGKILEEGKGEVQEMIDMCDFAVGLSRQLYGLTIQSERPQHRMSEQWHPPGPVAVITAFNFPVAVWAWNAMLAAVCRDTIIWKPSSKTPLCAIAVHNIISKVLKKNNVPEGVFNLVIGNSKEIGDPLISDNRIPLVSVTGSVPKGKYISQVVGKRLGRCIAELGGNNAIIISKHANLYETAIKIMNIILMVWLS
jgi:aldehyde dehydrogenase (NAD+)